MNKKLSCLKDDKAVFLCTFLFIQKKYRRYKFLKKIKNPQRRYFYLLNFNKYQAYKPSIIKMVVPQPQFKTPKYVRATRIRLEIVGLAISQKNNLIIYFPIRIRIANPART